MFGWKQIFNYLVFHQMKDFKFGPKILHENLEIDKFCVCYATKLVNISDSV